MIRYRAFGPFFIIIACGQAGVVSGETRQLPSSATVAYARPVVTESRISYADHRNLHGYQENDVSGTGNAFNRECRTLLSRKRPAWSLLDSLTDFDLCASLMGRVDTVRGLDSRVIEQLRTRGIEFCIVVYDLRLTHSQSMTPDRYVGGAKIRRRLFFRGAVIDVSKNQQVWYKEVTVVSRVSNLGLMASGVRKLFGMLL
jgi:hypothetical protein